MKKTDNDTKHNEKEHANMYNLHTSLLENIHGKDTVISLRV